MWGIGRGEATAAAPRQQSPRGATSGSAGKERARPPYSSLRHFSPHAHSPPPRPSVTGADRSRPAPTPLAAHGRAAARSEDGSRVSAGPDRKPKRLRHSLFCALTVLAASQLLPPPSPSFPLSLLLLRFLAAAAAPHPSAPRSAAAAAQNDAISQRHRRLPHNSPPPAPPGTAPAAAPAAPARRPRRPGQPRARSRGTGGRNLWSWSRSRWSRPGGRAQSGPSSAQRRWEGRGEPEPRLFKGDRAYS